MAEADERLVEALRASLKENERLTRRVRERDETEAEPIAIIGAACRFPGGVDSPEDLWRLLAEGRDVTGPFPTDRGWDLDHLFDSDPAASGRTYVDRGGFLADAALFDAALFDISPREALAMDPQQRVLLETAWRAVEHARIDPRSLRGTPTGVFVGVSGQDYDRDARHGVPEVEGYLLAGNTTSVASGRLAYTLGLEGPALSVDTACSSSLVALHLAARSLRSGESRLALVGGATVLTSPHLFVEFARQRGLAPDGRCKSFADAADGTAWSEGAGLLLVERLSDALRHGRRILAVVRATAVNSDGASHGLTAPNGPAQQRMIRTALAAAGLEPADVDAVEAHGTGTALGDPIEAQALLATYGQRRDTPLLLGSVKSNLGHTQAAAGVAGVLRTALALGRGVLPRTLHVDRPTSHVDWTSGAVTLTTEDTPWPEHDRPRRAAVSSFGISGTNAHVILEQAPPPPPNAAPGRVRGPLTPLVLSARTPEAVPVQARNIAEVLRDGAQPADLGHSLATTRASLDHRAVVLGRDRADLLAGLAEVTAPRPTRPGRLAVLFGGQGTQRPGLGRRLHAAYPAFAAALDEVCAALEPELGFPVRDLVLGETSPADAARLDRTGHAQPALFAVEAALHAVVSSWGVRAEVVAGHSVGELTAAYVAGVWDLPDACRVVAARARLMDALPDGGAMAALNTDRGTAEALRVDGVEIAAVNGPEAVVVSGPAHAVDAAVRTAAARGIRATRLRVSHAFHSALVEPALADLRAALDGVTFHEPGLTGLSNVTGGTAERWTDPDYWVEHARATVLFGDLVAALPGLGVTAVLELGADSTLTGLTGLVLGDAVPAVPALRRDHDEAESLLRALADLHVAGVPVAWREFFEDARTLDLPGYPFHRRHYWLTAPGPRADGTGLGVRAAGHPLLGGVVDVPGSDEVLFTGRLCPDTPPWLADHRVLGRTVVPGAALVDLALRVGDEVGHPQVTELTSLAPLVLDGPLVLRVVVAPADATGHRPFTLHARPESGDEWTRHATGTLGVAGPPPTPAPPPAAPDPVDTAALYAELAERGLDYGPSFQGLRAARRDGTTVHASVEVPGPAEGFGPHPAVLDSTLHALHPSGLLPDHDGAPLVPYSWRGVRAHHPGTTAARATITRLDDSSVSLLLTDGTDRPLLTVDRLTLRPATPPPAATSGGHLHATDWVEVAPTSTAPAAATEWAPSGDAAEELPTLLDLLDRPDRVVVRTRGAVDLGDEPVVPEAAGLWGLVRSAQAEHPGRLVLLDADDSAEAVRLALATGEPQVAVRDGRVFAPRLTPVAEDTAGRRSPTAHGTVLVTGGTGGVGSHVVRHLVHQWGATRVVVAARSDTGVADLVADCGEAVRFVPCDVSNPDELAGLLATLADTLAGVVHAAGVLDDGVLTSLTPDRLRRVAAPKAGAARTLDQLTRDLDLDFLVAFTSAAGVLGAPGQAAYAAANAEVDALMARRRRQGLPGQTVAWGLWADTGMARTLTASERRRLVTTGFPPLDPPRALELLDLAMTRAEPSLVALDLDPGQLARHPDPPALLTDLLPAARPRTAEPPPPPSDPLALVRAHLAAVLGHDDPRRVDAHRGLRELGVDSLAAVELRNRLSAATGRPLPATLAFDHPTAERLAAFLAADGHPEETPAAAPTAGSSDDPIAIVGLACRYPGGVRGPDDLWDLLTAEVDAIGPFPTDRGWDLHRVLGSDPTRPGTSSVGEGGFLDDAALFDAGLFGISPREALAMDPQQRQLLETSWEALEHAGIDPRSARGSRTGVFTGIMYHDYGPGFADAPPEVEGLLGAGTTGSVASGRVAHVLGLEGPALTVDTACSSSLVAVHLAARSLRTGESTLALAGGATVMSTPAAFVEFSRQGGLAADGRCKSFSEDADGTAWSEGVGVLVLERLSDARRHGRHVLGLLRGSAVNHDGAASGLTAPNGPAQRRVIRAALADAGLTARDVDVVEAHGTGTALGDPIEAHALLTTYGADREAPLLLGTVKSNLGHTQAAAGVAGVIKALLAMRHGTVPRTLHVTTPTSRVDWSAGAVRLATETRPWPDTPGPRRAAVSSFGFSGTNAHVVLEAPPPTPAREEPGRTENPVPLLLSGRTPSALRAQAARLAELVDTRPEVPLGALARSLAHTRARLDHRAVVLADDRPAASAALGALARGETNPRLVSGVVPVHQLAVVFGGQGSQRIGMGRELHDRFPVYADTFDRVCAALDAELAADRPLAEVVFGADADALDRTGWAQPALFAVEAALHALVSSWGVRAEVVAGHSVGELTAAYVAGVWDLPDACRVVAARARLMDALPDGGAMVAVAAGRGEVEELLVPGAGVGAVNGPTSVVVSGESGAVATVAEAAEARGLRTRALRVSHAFHSHLVEPVLADFARVLREVRFAAPTLPGLSNVTGGPADRWTDPDYWVDHVRAPVLFADDLAALEASGVDAVLELGADATLTGLAATVLAEPGRAVAALRRDRPEAASLLAAVGELYCAGVPVEWDDLFGAGDWVDLPTYPFDRERFWLTGTSRPAADTSGLGVTGTDHPLLAAAVEVPGTGAVVLTGALSTTSRPWLADHRVLGQVVVPGAAIVEMAVRAGDEVGRGTVDELVTTAPLVLSDHEPTQLRLVVARENDQGHRPFTLHARLESEGEWRVHATGALSAGPDHAPAPDADLARRAPVSAGTDGVYETFAAAGLDYGPAFRGLRATRRDGDHALASVELPEPEHASATAFGVHPALLDAALHAVGAAQLLPAGDGGPLLPYSWRGVTPHASGATAVRVRVSRLSDNTVSLRAVDAEGVPVLTVDRLMLRAASPEGVRAAAATGGALHEVAWRAVERPTEGTVGWSWDRVTGADALRDLDTAPDVLFWEAASGTGPVAALDLVQTFLAADRFTRTRLVVLTRDAVTADPDEGLAEAPVDPAAAGVWGLLRSAQSENPGRILLVDTDRPLSVNAPEVRGAVAAGEPQLALRSGRLWAPRMRPVDGGLSLPGTPWTVGTEPGGSLDGVRVDTARREALGLGEIRVSVRASGVNFRDVMTVLGMYPGEPLPLGLEAAGVVTEVGRGVDGFAVGDRVMGLCEGGFASEVVVDHRMWSRFPGSWSFAEAATVPVTFLTAWYGLRDLGRLVEGESVLVHSAAGGVGMAAVQLAREWGAVVYGTCGPVKRGFVEALGVAPERVASSRDTGFAERFGRVDVVLNSLAGEFVDASRGLLGEGGRFVEMGKTDLRDPGEFPGVEYRSFDLLEAGPVRIREMFTELLPLFEDGSLTPLPVSTWDIRRCSEALRFMSQARHVGKIVVTVPRAFDPDAPVLVTGGTGGVGAHLVRHLVSAWGARHVVVASRRGLDAPGAADLVADHDGAVTVTACDVTDQDSLTALLGAHPDLQGVVHAAGTVDDGVLGSLTADRVRALLAPKADAAELLDQATRTHDLSFFVGFSSSAGVLGAPGQAGYASANATLDAVALRRRQRGLPGQSLAWGLWADTGMAGDLTDTDRRRLAEQGFPPLTADQALGLFDQATRRPEALLVPLRVDPRRLGAAAPPLLRDLAGPVRRTATTTAPAPDTSTLVRQLAGLSPAEAAERLTELAVDRASAVLGHDGTRRVQPDEAFADLGFDSLLAVEFRNGLNAATGLTLPATVTFDHPTPRAVGRALLAELDLDGVPSTSALLAQLDRIDAAVDALGADESGRAALAARLHALAERLTTPDTEAGAAGAVGVGDRIADASADELADLLSEEFGIS